MRRSQIIEQRPGRALNVPTTAVGPGHSRVQAERHPARRPGALGISQAENAGSIPVIRSRAEDQGGAAHRAGRAASTGNREDSPPNQPGRAPEFTYSCERAPLRYLEVVRSVSGTSVLRRTRWGRSQCEPAGDARRQRGEDDLVESPLGEGLFDGLHRVRVAHGAVRRGADLAETVQFGVEVGLRLSNALVARSDVGRVGQQIGVDGEGAAERVEVVDEMGGGLAGARIQNSAGPRAIRSRTASSSSWPPSVWFATTRYRCTTGSPQLGREGSVVRSADGRARTR